MIGSTSSRWNASCSEVNRRWVEPGLPTTNVGLAVDRRARAPFQVLRRRDRLAVLIGTQEAGIERVAREVEIVGVAAELRPPGPPAPTPAGRPNICGSCRACTGRRRRARRPGSGSSRCRGSLRFSSWATIARARLDRRFAGGRADRRFHLRRDVLDRRSPLRPAGRRTSSPLRGRWAVKPVLRMLFSAVECSSAQRATQWWLVRMRPASDTKLAEQPPVSRTAARGPCRARPGQAPSHSRPASWPPGRRRRSTCLHRRGQWKAGSETVVRNASCARHVRTLITTPGLPAVWRHPARKRARRKHSRAPHPSQPETSAVGLLFFVIFLMIIGRPAPRSSGVTWPS